jgi:DNA-binding MurR/RpiR family transcriptional regulator
VEKAVVNALRHADAAIIIGGTASHILVQLAKQTAQRFEVAWLCIDKASDKQVTAALGQLFPERRQLLHAGFNMTPLKKR